MTHFRQPTRSQLPAYQYAYGDKTASGVCLQNIFDYSPFGAALDGRTMQGDGYRYGFGGHEKDDEIKGDGNQLAFGDYGYDPRLGRRWCTDPLKHLYAPISPYSYALNNPILFTDTDGNVVIGSDGKPVTYEKGKDGVVTWSANATQDIIEVGNAMLSTDFGEKAFNKWQNSKTQIHITIDRETENTVDLARTTPRVVNPDDGLGEQNSDGQYEGDVDVVFYSKKIDADRAEGSGKRFEGASLEEAYGATGTHEVYHNEEKQIKQDFLTEIETEQNPSKNLPINSEVNFRKEYQDKHPDQKSKTEKGMKIYEQKGYKGLDKEGKPQ